MLVYDITSEKSFNNLSDWHKSFLENNFSESPTSPFILVGNKLDQSVHRTVARRRAQEWANDHQISAYFETSAKEGVEVENIFLEAAKLAVAADSGMYAMISESTLYSMFDAIRTFKDQFFQRFSILNFFKGNI